MEDRSGDIKGFSWTGGAWYAKSILPRLEAVDEVMFGFYDPQGGTSGEMSMRWTEHRREAVPYLTVFCDAWAALFELQDVLEILANRNDDCISPSEFMAVLTAQGFKDLTNYEGPQ